MAVPNILPQDLFEFQSSHFAAACTEYFSKNFLWPTECDDTEEDSLGYYDDGTKRTLTDEQIAIFRHSETQSLQREKERLEEKCKYNTEDDNLSSKISEDIQSKNCKTVNGIVNATPNPSRSEKPLTNKARKAIKAKQNGYFRQNLKPDLRKRTWDKVETGLGCLDYDESPNISTIELTPPTHRRRVTYDD